MFSISSTDIMLSVLVLLSIRGKWASCAVSLDLSKLYSDFSGSLVRVFSFYCILSDEHTKQEVNPHCIKEQAYFSLLQMFGISGQPEEKAKSSIRCRFCQNYFHWSPLVLHWTVPDSKYSNLFFAYKLSPLDNSVQEWNCFHTQRKLLDVW